MKEISIEQLKRDLEQLLKTAPDNYIRFLKSKKYRNKYENYIDKINELTPALQDPYYKLQTKIYWILHDIHDFPKCHCEGCHNVITRNVVSAIAGYSGTGLFCSNSCAQKSQMHKDKMQKIAQEKYGSSSIVGSPAVRAKIKKTFQQKVTENPDFYTDRAAKSRETCRQRYGVDNPQQNREIRDRTTNTMRKTMLKKYGCDNALSSPEVQRKIQQTNINRYGATTIFRNPDMMRDILERAKSPESKAKRKQTVEKRYGVSNSFQTQYSRNAAITTIKTKCYNRLLTTNVIPGFSLEEYLKIKQSGKSIKTVLPWHCMECGCDFEAVPFEHCYNGSIARCMRCHPIINIGYSAAEKTVLEFVKEILPGEQIIENDKNTIINPETGRNLELDIFIPSLMKAIEFQGTYWHSLEKQKKYDVIKIEECRNNGIDLMQLDEQLWTENRDMAKAAIMQFIFDAENIA